MKFRHSAALCLVVIVAATFYQLYNRSPRGHPQASARTAMSRLIIACDDYYEAYATLPLGSKNHNDTTISTTGRNPDSFMNTLLGLRGAESENFKLESFFTFKAARKNNTGGLARTESTAELFDPWGNPYHVILDYDQDGQLRDPFTGKIKTHTRILIWSPGPDKKYGTKKTNKDNIYSWNR